MGLRGTLKILAFFVPFLDKMKKKSIQKVTKNDFSFGFRNLVHKTKVVKNSILPTRTHFCRKICAFSHRYFKLIFEGVTLIFTLNVAKNTEVPRKSLKLKA